MLYTVYGVEKSSKKKINIVQNVALSACKYKTNNSGFSIDFEIKNNQIYFKRIPVVLRDKDVLVYLKDKGGKEYCKKYSHGIQVFNISGIPDGIYFLQIYIFISENMQYWSFLNDHSVALLWIHNKLITVKQPYLYQNADGFEKFSIRNQNNQGLLRPTNQIQSSDYDIVKLSREITRGIMTQYNKVLAIHDWVANNIYYDIDAYQTGQYKTNDNSALNTLKLRCGVCQGYSNLTIALLRALGFYSGEVPCNSAIDEVTKAWRTQDCNLPNHVISAVLIERRWVLLDVTWDSDNIKSSNQFKHRTGIGTTHLFFDPTLEFLSATHQLFF